MPGSWPRPAGILPRLLHTLVLTVFLRRSVVVRATECLIGCALMAMHPFDEEDLVTWDERGACDYYSLGCDVNVATNIGPIMDSMCDPADGGCLWASSTGTDGTSGCVCDLCFGRSPGLVDGEHYYMPEYPIWTRIQCLVYALEWHGFDMSACVGQVMDSASMVCVDEPYEKPMVAALDCDLSQYSDSGVDFWNSCDWAGETREATEMFADGLLVVTTPAPTNIQPINSSAPTNPEPITSAPTSVTSAPANMTLAPTNPGPITPAPTAPVPITPAPIPPVPVTPVPTIPAAPPTPAPITAATPGPTPAAPTVSPEIQDAVGGSPAPAGAGGSSSSSSPVAPDRVVPDIGTESPGAAGGEGEEFTASSGADAEWAGHGGGVSTGAVVGGVVALLLGAAGV